MSDGDSNERDAITAAKATAAAFVAARRTAAPLSAFPGIVPQTLAQAYGIQREALALWGRAPIGWKVGRVSPDQVAGLGCDRLAGPIFDAVTLGADGLGPAMPIFVGGFAAAEAEFLIRIDHAPDPAKRNWTMDEATALIGAIHVGIELASSPFAGINDMGAAVTISDFGNNNGLLIGPPVPDWQTLAWMDWTLESRIDGAVVGAAMAREMLDGPIGALRFLLEVSAARGIALTAGQWVSSGAVTGVHQVGLESRFAATFGPLGPLGCTFRAAEPTG